MTAAQNNDSTIQNGISDLSMGRRLRHTQQSSHLEQSKQRWALFEGMWTNDKPAQEPREEPPLATSPEQKAGQPLDKDENKHVVDDEEISDSMPGQAWDNAPHDGEEPSPEEEDLGDSSELAAPTEDQANEEQTQDDYVTSVEQAQYDDYVAPVSIANGENEEEKLDYGDEEKLKNEQEEFNSENMNSLGSDIAPNHYMSMVQSDNSFNDDSLRSGLPEENNGDPGENVDNLDDENLGEVDDLVEEDGGDDNAVKEDGGDSAVKEDGEVDDVAKEDSEVDDAVKEDGEVDDAVKADDGADNDAVKEDGEMNYAPKEGGDDAVKEDGADIQKDSEFDDAVDENGGDGAVEEDGVPEDGPQENSELDVTEESELDGAAQEAGAQEAGGQENNEIDDVQKDDLPGDVAQGDGEFDDVVQEVGEFDDGAQEHSSHEDGAQEDDEFDANDTGGSTGFTTSVELNQGASGDPFSPNDPKEVEGDLGLGGSKVVAPEIGGISTNSTNSTNHLSGLILIAGVVGLTLLIVFRGRHQRHQSFKRNRYAQYSRVAESP